MLRRFGQLESVTNQLFNLLNKHEHLAAPVATLAAHPALRSDDSRLVGKPDHFGFLSTGVDTL